MQKNVLISVATRLKSVMTSRRCSDAELADELGVAEAQIRAIKNGKKVSLDLVNEIAEYLSTTAAYLIGQSPIDLLEKYAKAYPF